MRRHPALSRSLSRPALIVLALGLCLTSATPARAGNWTVELLPVYVDIQGHDPQVLTIRQGASAAGTQVTQAPDSGLGYATRVVWERDTWSYGLDLFVHRINHPAPDSTAAAQPGSEIRFDAPGRTFISMGPDETLFHRTLEDTTIELWIADLYAIRTLRERDGRSVELLIGLRNADFDNDYRAIAGIEGVGGTRIDASSNYSRMPGPLVGLALELQRGRNTVRGELRGSVVFGEAELSRTLRDFTGPSAPFSVAPEEVPPGTPDDLLYSKQDVEIPMTDLRVEWAFEATPHVSVGAHATAISWWGLSVPPGVQPGSRSNSLEEADLVTVGLGATLAFRF